jgi:hypothetical protein
MQARIFDDQMKDTRVSHDRGSLLDFTLHLACASNWRHIHEL